MRTLRTLSTVALPALIAAVALGYSQDDTSVYRACEPVLEVDVCTWVEMDGATPLELGASIPMALIEGVPADAPMTWPPEELAAIVLPPEARSSLGIDHLGINWEAHGHPPGPFMTPHFDFHFYNADLQEVRSIDCSDSSKPTRVPAGYQLPDIDIEGMGTLLGLCVPRMGMHAMPTADLEAEGPFEATMVVGYYGGQPIFFEPMIARDRLLERTDITLPIPTPDALPPGVLYPTDLVAEYDESRREYRLRMTGFRSQ